MNNEKMKKFGFTRKIFDEFQGLPLLLELFSKSSTISMILFRNVSFPKKINNPFWVVTVFPKKSDNFHWT